MSESPNATAQTPPAPKIKSPLKKRHEALGFFFGQPLESFEKLLEVQPSTSTATTSTEIKPTNLDIIRHWMYLEGQNRTSMSHSDSMIGNVTDNLMEFYSKHYSSVDLR